MVRRLHGAGIEVILDVVYNHTAEGGYSVCGCATSWQPTKAPSFHPAQPPTTTAPQAIKGTARTAKQPSSRPTLSQISRRRRRRPVPAELAVRGLRGLLPAGRRRLHQAPQLQWLRQHGQRQPPRRRAPDSRLAQVSTGAAQHDTVHAAQHSMYSAACTAQRSMYITGQHSTHVYACD